MLQSLVEQQQRSLLEAVRVGKIGLQAPINMLQWDMMEQVRFVLKRFKDSTNALSIAALDNVLPDIEVLRKVAAN